MAPIAPEAPAAPTVVEPEPKAPAAPEPPPGVAVSAATVDVVGRWVLDLQATKEAVLAWRVQQADGPEEEAEIRADVEEEFAGMELELALDPGGTFTGSAQHSGERTARGTWTRDGDAVVLRTTHEDDVEQADPEEIRARVAETDGSWRLLFGEADGPPHLVLRRPQ